MTVCNFNDLIAHVGHSVVVVTYGKDEPWNVAIECEDCNEVLLDFDKYDDDIYYDGGPEKVLEYGG